MLAAREWTEDQVKFMEWLCLPGDDLMGEGKGLRHPKTITALAKELGYHRDTLYQWQSYPGWSEALNTVAERTFYYLKPDFYRTAAAALLKPGATGYDRILTAAARYLLPSLENKAFNGDWGRELPVLSGKADASGSSYAKAVGMIRELPLDQREIFLSILDNLFSQSSEPQAVPRHISVRKVYTGEEPAPAQELPALPAPLASVDTTLDTPRYDPSRGVRKPVRKPR
jgi:hypothetical protein